MRPGGSVVVVAALAAAIGSATLGSACAPEDIVLAQLPPSPDGGTAVDPQRCVDTSECDATAFCVRHDCNDVAGTCEARPVVCDEDPRPVCGCDGITYFNDCLRRAAGITGMTNGECTVSARTCSHNGPGGPSQPCPPETFCARLLPPVPPGSPDMCPPDVPGTCWALPAVCGGRAGGDRWTACMPGAVCVTTCDAIRTGEPHRRAFACP